GLTYPLYLLHQFIGYISLNALAPQIGKNAAFLVVLAGMLLASFLVWRFFEKGKPRTPVHCTEPRSKRSLALSRA
ncbi:MAG: hypothetical protein WBM51_03505, partial [Pseudolabrys sp.]